VARRRVARHHAVNLRGLPAHLSNRNVCICFAHDTTYCRSEGKGIARDAQLEEHSTQAGETLGIGDIRKTRRPTGFSPLKNFFTNSSFTTATFEGANVALLNTGAQHNGNLHRVEIRRIHRY
jgi:hypothetical protein